MAFLHLKLLFWKNMKFLLQKMLFKRYQIGEVFRDGPVESARYRQFTQCDVDIVGCREMTADAEIIALISRAFEKLGLDCVIKINSRKLLNDILNYCKVPKNKIEEVIIILLNSFFT